MADEIQAASELSDKEPYFGNKMEGGRNPSNG